MKEKKKTLSIETALKILNRNFKESEYHITLEYGQKNPHKNLSFARKHK